MCKFKDTKKSLEIPFSSSRKRMSCIITTKEGKKLLLIKGASEIILSCSSKYHNLDTGEITPIDSDFVT